MPPRRPGPTRRRRALLLRLALAALVIGSAVVVMAADTVTASPIGHELAAGRISAAQPKAAVVSAVQTDRREQAVSRDSHREAVTDAQDQRLQSATERAAENRKAALATLTARAHREAARVAKEVARKAAQKAARKAAANAWHLPVTPGGYHLTSRFGDCSSLWSHCHTGLDFAAPDGTPIHAVASGIITETSWAGAYGNRTIMRIAGGTELWYCHQSSQSVRPGERVVTGQVIGAVGSTGNTTGPHVHLEVRPHPDHPVDPFAVLVSHGLHP